jgi:hypothetical protein
MPKIKPGEMNFDHPATTGTERGIRQRAGNAATKAGIAREYGNPNIGRMMDAEAERLHKQADDMAKGRKGK